MEKKKKQPTENGRDIARYTRMELKKIAKICNIRLD